MQDHCGLEQVCHPLPGMILASSCARATRSCCSFAVYYGAFAQYTAKLEHAVYLANCNVSSSSCLHTCVQWSLVMLTLIGCGHAGQHLSFGS